MLTSIHTHTHTHTHTHKHTHLYKKWEAKQVKIKEINGLSQREEIKETNSVPQYLTHKSAV